VSYISRLFILAVCTPYISLLF